MTSRSKEKHPFRQEEGLALEFKRAADSLPESFFETTIPLADADSGTDEQVTPQVTAEATGEVEAQVTPQVTPQVAPQVTRLLVATRGGMDRAAPEEELRPEARNRPKPDPRPSLGDWATSSVSNTLAQGWLLGYAKHNIRAVPLSHRDDAHQGRVFFCSEGHPPNRAARGWSA